MSDGQLSTRERIIETGLRLFSQKGYLGATTKEISAESGIAEVTLFRHFPSKESLFKEVLATYTFLPTLKEIVPLVEVIPYEEALAEIARRFIDTLRLRKDFIRIMHSECHLYPEEIKKLQHSFLAEMMDTLAAFFASRRRKGELKSFDGLLAARLFLGTFYHHFITREVVGIRVLDNYDDDTIIGGYINIFSRGTRK